MLQQEYFTDKECILSDKAIPMFKISFKKCASFDLSYNHMHHIRHDLCHLSSAFEHRTQTLGTEIPKRERVLDLVLFSNKS